MAEGGGSEESAGPESVAPSVLDQSPGDVELVHRGAVFGLDEGTDEPGADGVELVQELGQEPAEEPAAAPGHEESSESDAPVGAMPTFVASGTDPVAVTVTDLPSSPAVPEQIEGASNEDLALLAETERWLQQAIGLLARDGRHQIADDLRSQIGRQPKLRPAVIVAGEDKRGKSSLVNALMRYPNLSPTGVEVVTAAPIVLFRSNTQDAFIYRYGDDEAQKVTFEEAQILQRWPAIP